MEFGMGLGKCRPTWLQRFNSMSWFIVLLSMCTLTQGIVIHGLVAVSIESIEKEFGLASKVSGVILAGQHASTLLVVTYVSFFGSKGNKPKWMGIGAIISGVGAIVFAAPKLVTGIYRPSVYRSSLIPSNTTSSYDICSPNRTLGPTWQCNENFSGEKLFNVVVFFVGQLIMGAGATPLYTLGPAYLDENVAPQISPVYLGIWQTSQVMGPAFGFLIGGAFQKVYTDIKVPAYLNFSSDDDRWVGAWWLGFLVMSGFFMITGALILLYPKEMKDGKSKRDKEISMGNLPGCDDAVVYTLKGYLKELLKLCTNKVFICVVLAATIQAMYGNGLIGFLIKVLNMKFGVSQAKASIVVGMALIFAIIGGVMGGSFIMKSIRVQVAGKSGAEICAIASFIAMLSTFMWLVPGCGNTNLAGVMVPYHNSPGDSGVSSSCNSHCKCSPTSYKPVCGVDQVTYMSPCFAGCTVVREGKDGVIFSNCSCIPSFIANNTKLSSLTPNPRGSLTTQGLYATSSTSSGSSTDGKCDRGCKNFYVFILLVIVASIIVGLANVPFKMVVMRCVADNKRSFALGMQTLFMRLFALPGPVIVGASVDRHCIAWEFDKCGRRKNCLDYDITLMSKKLVMLGSVTAAIGTALFALGWWFFPKMKSNDRNGSAETEDALQLVT